MRFSLPSIVVAACLASASLVAQDASSNADEIVRLKRELQETRSGLADSRREIEELRQSFKELRDQVQGNRTVASAPAAAPVPTAEPTAASADQDVGFLAAKVNELHQDKVESASKYPVKLSGLVLFNAYRNSGALDIQDLPSLAFPSFPGFPDGSAAATLRQTMLGISATGPKIFGARTSANAEIDFAGGSPTTSYGVTAGLLRLRTANINLDWRNTSLHIGQDTPFFSPLSPTSYATVWEPAMAWSGNLWVWTPQIVAERRLTLRPRFVSGSARRPARSAYRGNATLSRPQPHRGRGHADSCVRGPHRNRSLLRGPPSFRYRIRRLSRSPALPDFQPDRQLDREHRSENSGRLPFRSFRRVV